MPGLEHPTRSAIAEAQRRGTTIRVPAPEAESVRPADVGHGEARYDPWIGDPARITTDPGLRPYIALALRYKKLIIAIMVLSVGVSVARVLLHSFVYMAKATILPTGGQGGAGVLGLLASFTGAPPMTDAAPENSSVLFPKILESRTVSLEVLNSKYHYTHDGRPMEGTLSEYLMADNVDKALLGLKGLRAIDVDKETGIISVSVTTRDPELSAAIANKFLDVLEKYNSGVRRLTASENSAFIRERLEQTRLELAQAEERLTTFRQENMRISSPELELEQMRFERAVTLKSQVFVTLTNQAELSRLEVAKNVPIVQVLDRAVAPMLPVHVPKIAILIGGFLVGLVLTASAVAALEFWHYLRVEASSA